MVFELLHADLYRLKDPAELDYLGIADQFAAGCLLLVEWPEQGQGRLPPADLKLGFSIAEAGRQVAFEGLTAQGSRLLEQLGLDALSPAGTSDAAGIFIFPLI